MSIEEALNAPKETADNNKEFNLIIECVTPLEIEEICRRLNGMPLTYHAEEI